MTMELPAQETAPIDFKELLDRCMGNIELANRVLVKLQSQFEQDMIELEQALSAKNGKLVASIAHRLKGSAANVAAHDLQKCAATIEELARNDLVENMSEHFDILRKHWLRLKNSDLSCHPSDLTS